MAGSASNVHEWTGADVYVGDPLFTGFAAPTNATTALSPGWVPVGFLSGSDGFVNAETHDSNVVKAWGGVVVADQVSNHEERFTFTALEDNATTYGIIHEGSTSTTTKKTVKVPSRTKKPWVMENTDAAGNKRRRYIHNAKVDTVGDLTENETDPPTRSITLLVYPDSDGTMYEEFPGYA